MPLHSVGPAARVLADELFPVTIGSVGSVDRDRSRLGEEVVLWNSTEFGWVTLVEPGENLGYGAAVNLVAERTSTPWFAASNADVVLEPPIPPHNDMEPATLKAIVQAGERAALDARKRRRQGRGER